MLKKRIPSFIVLISIIIASLYVDWNSLLAFSLCGLIITIFISIGLYEYFTMLQHKGISAYKYFGTVMGTVLPLSIVFHFEPTKKWELFFIVLALLFLILMQFRRRNNTGVIIDISTTLFGIMYVSWLFSFLIKIIYLPSGIGLLIAVLLMTKLGDIGAYLIGVRFGKTPFMGAVGVWVSQ